MTVQQLTEIEITTACNCVEFDEDDNELAASQCWGYEYQESVDYLKEKLGEWLTANEWTDETIIRVQFSGVSWQRVAGYGDITVADIPEFLTLNGEFRIVFTLTPDNKELTARRYSHDEPMGTGLITFTRSPFTRCAYCGDPAECSQLDGQEICQHCKEWKGIN